MTTYYLEAKIESKKYDVECKKIGTLGYENEKRSYGRANLKKNNRNREIWKFNGQNLQVRYEIQSRLRKRKWQCDFVFEFVWLWFFFKIFVS